MSRATTHPKEATFNLRIDPVLKAEFSAATEAEDKPAAQVLREFMRRYVAERARAAYIAEAGRQSRAIAERAKDPTSDEYAVMRELEAELDADHFADSWKA